MSLRTLADEVSRVSLEVGSKGRLGGQAHVPDVEGVWKDLTVNVSQSGMILSSSLRIGQSNVSEFDHSSEVYRYSHYSRRQSKLGLFEQQNAANDKGDLSKMIEIEAEGEMAILKNVSYRLLVISDCS